MELTLIEEDIKVSCKMRESKSTNSLYRFGGYPYHIFVWARILLAKSEGKLSGRRIPLERRKRVIRGAARCYRDDGLIRADFQGERAARAVPPTKKSTPMSAAREDARPAHLLQSKSKRVTFSKRAVSRPGPQFGRENGPRTRVSPRHAAPRPISFHRALPRRSALIPSYLGTHHATGCLFSVSLSLISPRRRGAAQHPLISLAGLLLESSSALILLGLPSLSDSLSGSPLLLVSTPRPERSLDSILMECLRGR